MVLNILGDADNLEFFAINHDRHSKRLPGSPEAVRKSLINDDHTRHPFLVSFVKGTSFCDRYLQGLEKTGTDLVVGYAKLVL